MKRMKGEVLDHRKLETSASGTSQRGVQHYCCRQIVKDGIW